MYHHRQTYSPTAEQTYRKQERRNNLLLGLLSVVVFGTIGVLLAWRG